MKYVASKHQKAFMAYLRPVYRAANKGATETALDELKTCWGSSIRIVLKSWRSKWENLSVYFKYPPDIRRVIYITSAMRRGIGSFASSPKPRGPSPMRTTC